MHAYVRLRKLYWRRSDYANCYNLASRMVWRLDNHTAEFGALSAYGSRDVLGKHALIRGGHERMFLAEKRRQFRSSIAQTLVLTETAVPSPVLFACLLHWIPKKAERPKSIKARLKSFMKESTYAGWGINCGDT